MTVNYLREIIMLNRWEVTHELDVTAYKLLMKLLHLANNDRFPEAVKVSNRVLAAMVGKSENAVVSAAKRLEEMGRVRCIRQKFECPVYVINYFSCRNPLFSTGRVVDNSVDNADNLENCVENCVDDCVEDCGDGLVYHQIKEKRDDYGVYPTTQEGRAGACGTAVGSDGNGAGNTGAKEARAVCGTSGTGVTGRTAASDDEWVHGRTVSEARAKDVVCFVAETHPLFMPRRDEFIALLDSDEWTPEDVVEAMDRTERRSEKVSLTDPLAYCRAVLARMALPQPDDTACEVIAADRAAASVPREEMPREELAREVIPQAANLCEAIPCKAIPCEVIPEAIPCEANPCEAIPCPGDEDCPPDTGMNAMPEVGFVPLDGECLPFDEVYPPQDANCPPLEDVDLPWDEVCAASETVGLTFDGRSVPADEDCPPPEDVDLPWEEGCAASGGFAQDTSASGGGDDSPCDSAALPSDTDFVLPDGEGLPFDEVYPPQDENCPPLEEIDLPWDEVCAASETVGLTLDGTGIPADADCPPPKDADLSREKAALSCDGDNSMPDRAETVPRDEAEGDEAARGRLCLPKTPPVPIRFRTRGQPAGALCRPRRKKPRTG